MAGFKTTYYSNLILNTEYSGGVVATWYFALFTVLPGVDGLGGTEVTIGSNGYARLAVTANTTNFPAIVSALMSNGTVFNFGTPTGPGWGMIVGVGQYDASSGGNLYRVYAEGPPIVAAAGIPFAYPIGTFTTSES